MLLGLNFVVNAGHVSNCDATTTTISTGSPYENNQNWTVSHTCPEDETAEFKLTKLQIEFDFDVLFIEYGNVSLRKLINR